MTQVKCSIQTQIFATQAPLTLLSVSHQGDGPWESPFVWDGTVKAFSPITGPMKLPQTRGRPQVYAWGLGQAGLGTKGPQPAVLTHLVPSHTFWPKASHTMTAELPRPSEWLAAHLGQQGQRPPG